MILPAPRAVRRQTFPNGLTALVLEDATHPVASAQIWCGSGSLHEAPRLGSGAAHFVEHMLFKGTEKRHYSRIATEIQDAGGSVNAYTSFDRTVYYVHGPAAGSSAWLEILADMARNSIFPEEEFAKEQEVIRREFAMGKDDPDQILAEMTFATAFRQHPMRHPIIGHLDVFNGLSRNDLVEFYRARYAPENLFVVVAGAVKAEAVFKNVEKWLGGMPRVGENPPVIPMEPPALGRRELRRSHDTQVTRLTLAWRAPGLGLPGHVALNMLAAALGSGDSSRLWRELREGKELAENISASVYTPGDLGLFFVDAECRPEQAEALIDGIQQQIRLIAEQGPRTEEMEKLRRRSMAGALRRMTTASGQAANLGISWHLARNPDLSRENLNQILSVTPEEVREAARTFLRDESLTLTVLGPEPKHPKRAVRSEKKNSSEPRRVELSCGLPVILFPDDRIPMMRIQGAFLGGSLADSKGKAGLCRLLASVVVKGAGERDAEALTEEVENLGGSIDSDSGNNSFSVGVGGFSSDADRLLDLMGDVLRHPRLEADHVRREREAQLVDLDELDDNPVSVAMREMRLKLFGAHPFSRPASGVPQDVKKLGAADVRAAAVALLHPGNGGVAVSGQFDADRILEGLERRLAGWRVGNKLSPKVPAPLKASARIALSHDKEQAIQVTAFAMPGLDHEDRIPLALLDEACSDMSSRLFTKIREEMGLAYFVGAGVLPGLTGGAFHFYLGTSPEKADEVEEVLRGELGKIVEDGLTAGEIERAKKTFLGKMAASRQRPGALAFEALLDEIYGLGFTRHREVDGKIADCSGESVADAAARLLTSPAVTVLLRPG